LRRQTATGGVNPAGSGRTLRLDPHSLPVSFDAHDTRADGGVRHIELHHERVVLRRAVSGMRMAINVSRARFPRHCAARTGRSADDRSGSSRSVAVDPALRQFGSRRNRNGVADVERNLRASATVGGHRARNPRRGAGATMRSRHGDRVSWCGRRLGDLLNPAGHYRGEREIIARD